MMSPFPMPRWNSISHRRMCRRCSLFLIRMIKVRPERSSRSCSKRPSLRRLPRCVRRPKHCPSNSSSMTRSCRNRARCFSSRPRNRPHRRRRPRRRPALQRDRRAAPHRALPRPRPVRKVRLRPRHPLPALRRDPCRSGPQPLRLSQPHRARKPEHRRLRHWPLDVWLQYVTRPLQSRPDLRAPP